MFSHRYAGKQRQSSVMETKECFSKKTIFIILVTCQIFFVAFVFKSWIAWIDLNTIKEDIIVIGNVTEHERDIQNFKLVITKESDIQHQDNVSSSFNINITPEIHKNTFVLIVINTIPSNFERRLTLRGTWAKRKNISIPANFPPSKPDDVNKIAHFFVVAFQGNSSIDKELEKEAAIHKDILRVSLNETYRGIVPKIWLAFEWLASTDINPRFIAKADDDVYVKIPDLARWLQENALPPANLYAGFVHSGIKVIREPSSPWYVSEEKYRDTYFPDYCAGPFYILSGNVFLEVLNASKVTKSFPVEDAYLGVLVSRVGVKPRSTGGTFFNWDPHVNDRLLKIERKDQIPSGVVLGDSLSSEAIQHLHRAYWSSNNTIEAD